MVVSCHFLLCLLKGSRRMSPAASATRPSLLARVRDVTDEAAWQEFFRCYSGLIAGFARQRGCSATMAADVLQETMAVLLQRLPSFAYDPAIGSFRSYLLRVVHSRIMDALRREQRFVPLSPSGDSDGSASHPEPATTPFREWEEAWDRNWDRALIAQALERVRVRVTATTYESFRLYVVEGLPVALVCQQCGLTPNAVYQHRNRLMTMLRRELAALRHELEAPGS